MLRVAWVLVALCIWTPCGSAWYLSNAGVMKTVAKGVLSSAVAFQSVNIADTDWSNLEQRLLGVPPVQIDAPKPEGKNVPLPKTPEVEAPKEDAAPPSDASVTSELSAPVTKEAAPQNVGKPRRSPQSQPRAEQPKADVEDSAPIEEPPQPEVKVERIGSRSMTQLESLAAKLGLELDETAPSPLLGGLRRKAAGHLSTKVQEIRIPEDWTLERYFPVLKQADAVKNGETLRDGLVYLMGLSSEERVRLVMDKAPEVLKNAPAGFESWWAALSEDQKLGVGSTGGVALLLYGDTAATVISEDAARRRLEKKEGKPPKELSKPVAEVPPPPDVEIEDIRARVAGTSIPAMPVSTATEDLAQKFYDEQVEELHSIIEGVQQELAQQREQTREAWQALQVERTAREAVLAELQNLKGFLEASSAQLEKEQEEIAKSTAPVKTPVVEKKPAELGALAQLVEAAATMSMDERVEVVEQAGESKKAMVLNGSGPAKPETQVPASVRGGDSPSSLVEPKKKTKSPSPKSKKPKVTAATEVENEARSEMSKVAVTEVIDEVEPKVAAKKQQTMPKKSSQSVAVAASSTVEVENDEWRSLAPSKIKRKTVSELQEFLSGRSIDTVDDEGKALRKPELLNLVTKYLA